MKLLPSCSPIQPQRRSIIRLSLAAVFLVALPLRAQLVVKLSPQTISEFEHYAGGVERELNERWHGQKNFLAVEDEPKNLAEVLAGTLFVRQMNGGRPVEISNGLIHDWLGTVYIPNVTVEQVVKLLEDFDAHQHIYPSVTQSHTVRQSGGDVTGVWRLQQKGLVPVILDVTEEAHYTELSRGKWKAQNYARDIRETDTGLFSRGRKYEVGEGHGYLWRLYAYWTLEAYQGGVLAECRTLSLSRDIPAGLAWAVTPYVQKMPQSSLNSILLETRKALAR